MPAVLSKLEAPSTSTRVILALGTIALASIFIKLVKRSRRLNILPGPLRPGLITGHFEDLSKAKCGTRYNAWGKEYGKAYRIWAPFGEPILVLTDPKGVAHVLHSKNGIYLRDEISRVILQDWFGKGLFPAEGEEHKRMRKSLAPAFSPGTVEEVSHVMFDLSYWLKTAWEDKIFQADSTTNVIDILDGLHTLTLDAVGMTTFSCRLSDTSSGQIPDLLLKLSEPPDREASTLILRALVESFPVIMKLPSPMKTWASNLKTELGRLAESIWTGAKNSEAEGMYSKVLDLIDESKTEDGEPVTREEAIAHIVGILFAGSESTANVMSECLYELSKRTDIQDKVRAELIAFEEANGRAPIYHDLMSSSSLSYFDAVIRETLRTKSVLMAITREACAADAIPLAYPIPGSSDTRHVNIEAGQKVYIAVRDGINVDDDLWGADATEFRPERWLERNGLPSAVEDIQALGHHLSFGDGQKYCLGRVFASAELKIVLSTLLRHFIFTSEGLVCDFYHLGGNTCKPKIRGREEEGIKMPLTVALV